MMFRLFDIIIKSRISIFGGFICEVNHLGSLIEKLEIFIQALKQKKEILITSNNLKILRIALKQKKEILITSNNLKILRIALKQKKKKMLE